MATNFPTSLDNLGNPAGSAPVNNPSHAAQHADVNDAIEALENKVGVNNSTVTTSLEYRVKNLETNPVVSYTDENARNAIGAALIGSGGITVTPNDSANTITVSTNNTIATKTYVDTAISGLASTSAETYVLDSLVGNPEGIATLDINSRVPLSQLGNLIDGAPTALDTLNELAAAINDDASYAATITTALGNKVSKAGGDAITSSLPGVISLTVKGAASQTANLQEWQNSAGTTLVNISSAGAFTITQSNTSTVPLTIKANSVATGSNMLEMQRPDGTVRFAIGNDGALTVNSNINFNGGNMTMYPANSGQTPLIVNGQTNQSVSLLIIKSGSSQSANLQEWQNSTGTWLTSINSNGRLFLPRAEGIQFVGSPTALRARIYSDSANRLIFETANSGYMSLEPTGALFISSSPDSSKLIIRASTSQTVDLQQWQDGYSSVLAKVGSSGQFLISPSNSSVTALTVKASPTYPAAMQEWQNSSGTVLAKIRSDGQFYAYGSQYGGSQYGSIGALGLAVGGQSGETSIHYAAGNLTVRSSTAGESSSGSAWTNNTSALIGTGYAGGIGLIIKSVASQTANLQEWQNSTGTILSKVDSTGAMFTITAPANTNTTQVATTAYVQTELADLVNSAPATLDTLKELSDALGADANFATTVTNNLALKAPLASPTLTGTPTAPTAAVGTDSTQVATTAFVIDQIDASTQPGALYQTTAPTSPEIGQIWIDSDENVTTFDSNIIRRKAITATAGQTVFTADLPFIDGFEQIFMNGLLLVKTTDYTTSNSNTVTLTSAAAASDIIEIVSVTGANSVNTYTQAEVDALLAANTSVAPLSISANTTLVAKKRYFVTSASALTLTLPASPALNDEIQIVDASGNASTYNITVARNGNKINGGTGNLIIDNNGGWYTLLYTGTTYGWKVG